MGFRFFSIPILAFAGVVLVAPARADDRSDAYPAPCDDASVTKADHDRAHNVFLSGKEFLEESDYDKAISYFKDAYTIDCSVHALLPIIATAYERKGDKPEAIRALVEYLNRIPAHAPDREIIERRVRNLKEQVAREQQPVAAPVAAPPPAPTTPPPSPSPTTPEVSPQSPAAPPPEPEASAHGGSGAWPWVLVGVGAAAVATGVSLVVVGAGDISSAKTDAKNAGCTGQQCPTGTSTQVFNDKQSNGYTLVNVGAAVGGVGLAAAIAGVWWKLTSSSKGNGNTGSAFVSPSLSTGYAGFVMGGRF